MNDSQSSAATAGDGDDGNKALVDIERNQQEEPNDNDDGNTALDIERNQQESPNDDDDDEIPVTLLTLPMQVREKIGIFLTNKDLLQLRLVCNQLRLEAEAFGHFNITITEDQKYLSEITIPFPHLNLLVIDTDTYEIPWGDCINDTIQRLLIQNITYKSFIRIGKIRTIQDCTLTTNTFQRPIPPILWNNLKSLQIVFHLPQNAVELFMLDNLDTLLLQQQQFNSLQNFRISLSNPYNRTKMQSEFSIRIARFISNHWKTLRSLEMEIEGELCISPNNITEFHKQEFQYNKEDNNEQDDEQTYYMKLYNLWPKTRLRLTGNEIENLMKVSLQNLEIRITEISCPRCTIWQDFIRNQMKLKCLLLNIIEADEDLSSNFFCSKTMTCTTQFEDLETLSVNYWGINLPFYSFDCKYLIGAEKLKFLELACHHGRRNQGSVSELLNIHDIPKNLETLIIDGFFIASNQLTTILQTLDKLKYLSILYCGTGIGMGFNINHCSMFTSLKNLKACLVDINCNNEAYNYELEDGPAEEYYGNSSSARLSLAFLQSKLISLFPTNNSDSNNNELIWRHISLCDFNENSHRFLFSKKCTRENCNYKGFTSTYELLSEVPPSHFDEVQKELFNSMKELIVTSRFRGYLYHLATNGQKLTPTSAPP